MTRARSDDEARALAQVAREPAPAEAPPPAAANEPHVPEAAQQALAAPADTERAQLRVELQSFERQFRVAHGRELRVRHDLWRNAEGAVVDPAVREYWRERYSRYYRLRKGDIAPGGTD